jgi:DnaJ-class molecular chaperone
MSLPSFPSTSGLKPSELHVYTIEECQSCGQKTKRDFKVGDFVMGEAGICEKCQGKKTIALIYGEKISAKTGGQGPRPR